MPGLCATVTRADIEAHDSSLTPGRYVGGAAPDLEEDGEFEERIGAIHVELAGLNEDANALAATIQGNFHELGV